MKILLVSFPRYSTDTVNPGEELLKGVLDQDVTPLLLPLSWSRSQIALENKIAEIHPDAVIVMNLCPYRDLPTLEQYASNKKEWVEPDIDQIYASGEEIEKGGPKNRATSLDLDALSVYLSAQGQRSSMGDISSITKPITLALAVAPIRFCSIFLSRRSCLYPSKKKPLKSF